MPIATRLAAATFAVASLTALPLTSAASSEAASTPAVKISYVFFDSPGADKGGNTSLNAEYVRLTNTTGTARSLKGWTLRDRSGHVYTFGAFTLKARATVTVHTGKGTATSAHRDYHDVSTTVARWARGS